MTIHTVFRGRERVPAIDLGGGLLRPVPKVGREIARAAQKAEADEALYIPPARHTSVTVIRGDSRSRAARDGATVYSGSVHDGAEDRRHARYQDYRSWKSRRKTQYK